MNEDTIYMRMALALAEKGVGWVNPNPMVGAVIVKDGRPIAQGYHHRLGGLHAERDALANCAESPAGATMYVTLEPCCHHGRQPPCTDAILEAGIARVVVGSGDPNPLVAGHGLSILREHGVEVTEHVLEEECRELNTVFFHYIQTGLPYVFLKYAMTLDGKIAAYTGASQWITGEEARLHVHRQRHRCSAIMVGIGTVLADDPLLTCRIPEGRNPVRVICDTRLRIPLGARIVQTADKVPTMIATCCEAADRQAPYKAAGCKLLILPEQEGHVDLKALLEALGQRQVDSVLAEGGGTLHWELLRQGLANRVLAYVAPKLIGGKGAGTPVEGLGFPTPDDATPLRSLQVTRLGKDILIESEVLSHVHGTG